MFNCDAKGSPEKGPRLRTQDDIVYQGDSERDRLCHHLVIFLGHFIPSCCSCCIIIVVHLQVVGDR